jgi:hypothetical protein
MKTNKKGRSVIGKGIEIVDKLSSVFSSLNKKSVRTSPRKPTSPIRILPSSFVLPGRIIVRSIKPVGVSDNTNSIITRRIPISRDIEKSNNQKMNLDEEETKLPIVYNGAASVMTPEQPSTQFDDTAESKQHYSMTTTHALEYMNPAFAIALAALISTLQLAFTVPQKIETNSDLFTTILCEQAMLFFSVVWFFECLKKHKQSLVSNQVLKFTLWDSATYGLMGAQAIWLSWFTVQVVSSGRQWYITLIPLLDSSILFLCVFVSYIKT